MKDLIFYDHKHNCVYIVRNPKSRKDAQKRLASKLVGDDGAKMDFFYTVESMDENVLEVEKISDL